MKKISIVLTFVLLSFFAFSGQSTKNVANVKLKRGIASIIAPDGTKADIKRGMWIKEGSIIKTGAKSFVRLSFIDKSSMNIGPKSELKIEKFSKEDAGVINILTGKIRAKVTKDYLKIDKDKSKLFIKSKSAVMGIRGTDFIFTANAKTGASTAVLFEGSVVFSKINRGTDLADLEKVVDRGRRIHPGEFSVAIRGKNKATIPSKMSSRQFRGLEKNDQFTEEAVQKKVKKVKSIVPPGLAGDIVISDNKNLAAEIKQVININVETKTSERDEEQVQESKGFVKGDDIKPVDGSIVHLESGTIIPLGVDSQFDANAGEWVSNSIGSIDGAGDYFPPDGYIITDEGHLLKTDSTTGNIQEVIIGDIKPLDEVKPLDDIQVKEYVAPIDTAPIDGIDPRTGEPILEDERPPLGEEPPPEGEEAPPVVEEGLYPGEEPDAGDDEGYLPPPPKPGDCSTCNQPGTYTEDGAPPPPPSGKTRVIINVTK
jgi:hypothetical protein